MQAQLLNCNSDLAAEAAKTEPQNVRAELPSCIFFERPPQNIRAESLELQIFPVYMYKLFVILVYSSLSCKV